MGVWWWEGGRRRRRGEGHLLRARAFSRGRALRGTASEDGATLRDCRSREHLAQQAKEPAALCDVFVGGLCALDLGPGRRAALPTLAQSVEGVDVALTFASADARGQAGFGAFLRGTSVARDGSSSRRARVELVCMSQSMASGDSVTEWLRSWTRSPLGSARRGSSPLAVELRCGGARQGSLPRPASGLF